MGACQDFDAARCSCFHAADKEKMLEIVNAAFGGLVAFNSVVQSMFRRMDLRRLSRSSSSFIVRIGSVAGTSPMTTSSDSEATSDRSEHPGPCSERNDSLAAGPSGESDSGESTQGEQLLPTMSLRN